MVSPQLSRLRLIAPSRPTPRRVKKRAATTTTASLSSMRANETTPVARRPTARRDTYSPRAKSAARSRRHVHLDAVVLRLLQQTFDKLRHIAVSRFTQTGEQRAAQLVVDGPSVVRVYERERPKLRALIEVGHAGRRRLQQCLRERVKKPRARRQALELFKVADEVAADRSVEE